MALSQARTLTLLMAAAGAAMPWLACNDEVLNPLPVDGAGGSGGGAGGAGSGGLQGPTIDIHLTVENAVDESPLDGVRICGLEPSLDCVETDAEGKTVVTVPAEAAIWATLERDDYASTLVGAQTGTEDMELTAPMVGHTLVDLVAGGVSVDLDDSKGQLVLITLGPEDQEGKLTRTADVTMSLEPPPQSGPYYLNEDNFIDPALMATSQGGGGLMFNLEPGNAVLTAEHPTLPCRDFLAHPLGGDRYDVRVLSGFITVVTIQCGEMGAGGAGGGGGAGATGGGGTGGAGGA